MISANLSYAKIDSNSIVGMWLFDKEGGTAVDSSGNEHDGEILGDIEYVEGIFDNAIQFPGDLESYVNIAHEDSLTLTTFSFAIWINMPDPGEGYRCIFSKTSDGLLENYAGYLDTGVKIFWGRFTSGGNTKWVQSLAGKTNVADEEWHHLAVTYDMEFIKTYVDGVVEIEVESNQQPDESSGPLTFGIATGQPYTFAGMMDEAILFDVGISQGDVQNIMNAGLDGVLAVSTKDKVTTTWARMKTQ